MNAILLTGTIDPSKFNNTSTALIDVNERLKQYCTAIQRWIEKSNFEKIVFIENSGYDFDYKIYEDLAKKNNKRFEYILAKPYFDETIKHGKSFGEIMLINEAVDKSILLRNETSFYKCTGRLYIKNCNSILKETHKCNNLFLGIPSDNWIITWFFKVEKDFYNKVLRDSYKEVNDHKGISIENIYFRRIHEHRSNVEVFSKYPNVEGICAGQNIKYHSGFLSTIYKNIKIKTGYFGI